MKINRTMPMNLKTRIIVYSVLVLSFSLFIIGFITYRISSSAIYRSIAETNQSIVNQTMETIDSVLQGIERETVSAFEEIDFNAYLDRLGDRENLYLNRLQFTELTTRLISVMDSVENVYLVGKEGKILSNDPNVVADVSRLTERMQQSDGRFMWTYTETVSYTANRKLIGVSRAIFNATQEYNGFILIVFKETTLKKFYPAGRDKKVMLIDEENRIISSNDKVKIGTMLGEIPLSEQGQIRLLEFEGGKHLVTSAASGYTQWSLVLATPYTDIFYELLKEKPWHVLIAFLCFLGFVGLIFYFADRLIRPLRQLNRVVQSMNRADNSLRRIRRLKLTNRFHFLSGWTFNVRLAVVLIVCIVMPVVILIFFSYNLTKGIIEDRTIEMIHLHTEQIEKRMESYFANLEKTIYYFYYDPDLIQWMKQNRYRVAYDKDGPFHMVKDKVENVLYQKRDILYIDIYNANLQLLYASKNRNNAFLYPVAGTDQLEQNFWLDTYKDDYNDYLITFARKVGNIADGSLIGYVFITVREADVGKNYVSMFNNDIKTFLINSDGKIMSYENKNSIGQPLENDYLLHINKGFWRGIIVENALNRFSNVLLTYNHTGNSGWKLVNIASLQYVSDSLFRILSFDLFVLLISTLAIAIFITRFTGRISRPINELTQNVVSFANNLFEYEKEARGDEVEQLKINFYHLMSKVDTLIREVYEIRIMKHEAELKQKEAELATLQAQINPHFLYNTLEIIRWKSMLLLDGENEVSDIVATLSDYFRISLSQGRKTITVEEEIEHVSGYIKIMNHRYKNKIDYRYQVSDEALYCLIPKITLQPVVENALYHGIKRKKGKGKIYIDVDVQNNELVLEVFDNGVGIDRKMLEKIRRHIDTPADEKIDFSQNGYGLKNVKQRLQMLFGEQQSIRIDSVCNEYTKVRITIPPLKQD